MRGEGYGVRDTLHREIFTLLYTQHNSQKVYGIYLKLRNGTSGGDGGGGGGGDLHCGNSVNLRGK